MPAVKLTDPLPVRLTHEQHAAVRARAVELSRAAGADDVGLSAAVRDLIDQALQLGSPDERGYREGFLRGAAAGRGAVLGAVRAAVREVGGEG